MRLRFENMRHAISIVAACACALVLAMGFASASWTFQAHADSPSESNPRMLTIGDAGDSSTEAAAVSSACEFDQEYEEGVVVVVFAPDVDAAEVNDALALHTCLARAIVTDTELQQGFATLPLAEGVSVGQAVEELGQLPGIDRVQPNYVYRLIDGWEGDGEETVVAVSEVVARLFVCENDSKPVAEGGALAASSAGEAAAAVIPDDPRFGQQKGMAAVRAQDAWGLVQTNRAVTIAVIDSGINPGHEDLKANIVGTWSVLTHSEVTRDTMVTTTYSGHGTHVAGIASAVAGNGTGVAGVSYNAGLFIVQAIDEDRSITSTDAAEALDKVLEKADAYNIRVVNMSFGAKLSADAPDAEDKLLLKKLTGVTDKGILVVASAGNGGASGAYKCFPADYDPAIVSVINANTTSANPSSWGRSANSNYNRVGETVKRISAPGSSILSTFGGSVNVYGTDSGTSMAAPFVSGIAALLFTVNPELTPAQASAIIYETAIDLTSGTYAGEGFDRETGYGLVNAYDAVRAAKGRITGKSELSVGMGTKLALVDALGDGDPSLWTWASSNPDVLTVDSDGTVHGLKWGHATVTATYVPFAQREADYKQKIGSPYRIEETFDIVVKPVDIDAEESLLKGGSLKLAIPSAGERAIVWTCMDTTVASVDKDGVVTGTSAGKALVVATYADDPGTSVYAAEVTVYEVRIAGAASVPVGSSVSLSVNAQPAASGWQWSSSNAAVASVDSSTGVVSGKKIGTTNITVSLKSNAKIKATRTIAVEPRDIAQASFAAIPAQTYSGAALEPAVTLSIGSTRLRQGTDFTVAYENNVSVGTATVTATGTGNYQGSVSATFPIVKTAATWTRLEGKEALDTMSAVVSAGWKQPCDFVVLTTSEGYWDALTATALAGLVDAPVLMTSRTELSAQTAAQLKRLKPKKIIACGGPSALANPVVKAAGLAAGGALTVRLYGTTMTDTADAILMGGVEQAGGTWQRSAFVCTSNGYWDALSVAPLAYTLHIPIVLTESRDGLSQASLAALKGRVDQVYIVGGTSVVSNLVEKQLEGAGIRVARRLWGQTAIDTSVVVADFGVDAFGMTANNMCVATQNGYWDALSGGAFCGRNGAVMVLVDGSDSASIADFVVLRDDSIAHGYVLGGRLAIGDDVLAALKDASS